MKDIAINQFLVTLAPGDAISNLAMQYRDAFRARGIGSEIYAETIDPRAENEGRIWWEYFKEPSNGDILIYHVSLYSKFAKHLHGSKNRLVIYYHNITPPEYFREHLEFLVVSCGIGREEAKSFAKRADLTVADSDFNSNELRRFGFGEVRSVPLPVDFSRMDAPGSPLIEEMHSDGRTNVLFVGRIIPNKKIEDIIRIFHLYRMQYDGGARLFLVGGYRSFLAYQQYLWRLAKKLGETENVIFTDHISDSDLLSYYRISDIFLMMSEHEGFCVPLLEAFHHGVPVIAYNGGAVGETMRGGGILFQEKNHRAIAALIDRLMKDRSYRGELLESQTEALKKYNRDVKNSDFVKLIVDYFNIKSER